ncbi:MAG: transcriptional regulator, GntR family [Actinomycetia bacterium]|nr:transcriptional regulator, GntR family [Actinomycetes bacterium]
MMGEFGPTTRLFEERIAEEMGHSRTPVREALIRLWTNGMLEKRDGRYYPILPDLTELRDLYELRITIELRGLTRVIESDVARHDVRILEQLRDHWRGLELSPPEPDPSFVEADESFHHALLASS